MQRFTGVTGDWTISSHLISDDQLSKGGDMEYGSVIRKTRHSRILPIYSAINLWLGDLRGIYGRDKSRGRVPRGSQAKTRATPAQANKWLKAKEKAPFSVELEKIMEKGGRDKREKQRDRQKQRETARYRTHADQVLITGKWNRIFNQFPNQTTMECGE